MTRFCLAVALCAAATAQVPFDHLIYARAVASNTVPAIGILDPVTGTDTPILPLTGALLSSGSRTVAIDPQAPDVLYTVTALSTSIAAIVPVLTLTGNEFARSNVQANLGAPGSPFHLRWAPGFGLLLLGRGGQVNHMFLRDMATGTITPQPTPALLPNDATDMAFLAGNAYATSEGTTSSPNGTIVEWDLTANSDRVVGSGYPPLTALSTFAGQLLAGDSGGTLHLVDPQTGATSPFLQTGLGRIVSIAVDSQSRVFVVAESGGTWTVHDAFNLQPPLYSSATAIEDLEVGPAAVPTMQVYGDGCTGSNALAPVLGYSARPALGGTFAVTLVDALPGAGAFLAVGSSRVMDGTGPLPRDLGALGMPGCTQYTDVIATLFSLTGGSGAAQWSFALPNNPAFAGVRIPAQCVCLDATANALGATTSNGGEAYVW